MFGRACVWTDKNKKGIWPIPSERIRKSKASVEDSGNSPQPVKDYGSDNEKGADAAGLRVRTKVGDICHNF